MPQQPIYMPGNPDAGAAGNLVAGLLDAYNSRKRQEQFQQTEKQIIDAVNSGGHDKGQAMLNSLPFTSFEQMKAAQDWFDKMSPPVDHTPVEVPSYGPNGESTPRYIPRDKLPTLNTPEGADAFKALTGDSLTNPLPAIQERRIRNSEQQQVTTNDRNAANDAVTREMNKSLIKERQTNAAKSDLHDALGIVNATTTLPKSIDPNGGFNINLDGADPKQAQAYIDTITHLADFRKGHEGDPGAIAREASKFNGLYDKPVPPPAPTPKPPEPSLWSRFFGGSTSHAPAAKVANSPTPMQAAPQAKATKGDKYQVGKVYQGANNTKAKYLGNGKWEMQ